MTDITDNDLNIEIAQALGYREETVNGKCSLVSPAGDWLTWIPEHKTVCDAIAYVIGANGIPAFATDLNAAYELPHEGYLLAVFEQSTVYEADFTLFTEPDMLPVLPAFIATDEFPARAICKAWIELKKAQEVGK